MSSKEYTQHTTYSLRGNYRVYYSYDLRGNYTACVSRLVYKDMLKVIGGYRI